MSSYGRLENNGGGEKEKRYAPECALFLAKRLEFLLEIFDVDVLPPRLFPFPARLIVLGGCTHGGRSCRFLF